MTRSLYIIGGPGSGKSTVMGELLKPWTPGPYERLTEREMFGHYMLNDDLQIAVYLGRLRAEYPGTDALSLSVAPHALTYLERVPPTVERIYGEGARLGHLGFLQALPDLTLVHLTVPPEVASHRRQNRVGKPLSEGFCRSQSTKASRVAQAATDAGIRVVTLDAERALKDLVAELQEVG